MKIIKSELDPGLSLYGVQDRLVAVPCSVGITPRWRVGKEQSVYRHLVFVNNPGFLLLRWSSASTGNLHVTGMDDLASKTASPRGGKESCG